MVISAVKNLALKVHFRLSGMKNHVLVIIFLIANMTIMISYSIFLDLINNQNVTQGFKSADTKTETFILVSIIAPVIETLIFQYGIIAYLKQKVPLPFACVISALLFGLSHFYNFYFCCFTFLSGLLFAYLFCLRKNMLTGLLITTVTHMLHNTIVFLIRTM
jgi:membrane protease YdiL (CAAX protease family)